MKAHGERLRAPTIRGFLEKHLRAKLRPVALHHIDAETFDALLTSSVRASPDVDMGTPTQSRPCPGRSKG